MRNLIKNLCHLYMSRKLCVNCDTELRKPYQIYINHHPKLVPWMKKVGYRSFMPEGSDFYLAHKKIFHRNNWELTQEISIGKQYANRYIYYWASHSRKNSMEIINACEAYNLDDKQNRNDGFTQCDNKGRFTFYIKNPQPYKENNRFYPSHMHFLISKSDKPQFLPKIGTYNIPNIIKKNELEMDKDSILINALPAEHYGKIHIPGSYCIPYKMGVKDAHKQLQEIIRLNHPEIQRKIDNGMSLMEVPIVLYCHNPKCDASHILGNKLYSAGVYNISFYEGGLVDWYKGKKV